MEQQQPININILRYIMDAIRQGTIHPDAYKNNPQMQALIKSLMQSQQQNQGGMLSGTVDSIRERQRLLGEI